MVLMLIGKISNKEKKKILYKKQECKLKQEADAKYSFTELQSNEHFEDEGK